MLIKLISIAVVLQVVNCRELTQTNYCLSDDPDPYLDFGSITSYNIIENNPESFTIADHEPVQIWILGRHGSRDASPIFLKNMKTVINVKDKFVNKSPDALCRKDLEALNNWNWNTTVESLPYDLNEQGWNDLKDLAIRYKNRFPNLMSGNYSEDDFYFRHTDRIRTKNSCRAFIDGLFGDRSNERVKIETPIYYDMLIMPFKKCDDWHQRANRHVAQFPERIKFLNSKRFKQLKSDISNRFGFEDELNSDLILAIYDNCRFEKTKNPHNVSPWCVVFSKDQLQLLEYYNDLVQFYECGYGYEYNYKFGCYPLQHLREAFEKTVANGFAKPKTIALITHETMFDIMYAALNFSKGELMIGEDYDDLLINRKYRPAINTPFACNIVVILHKSNIEDDKYKVQIMLNEKPMHIDICENGICDWDTFKNHLSFTRECNLDFCNNKKE